MKTKLVLLFTLIGLTACTTPAVKMSPEETQSFFTDNSDLALNTMCDFSGVSCKKNYNKFGAGKLAGDDSRQHFKSGQLKIYTYVSSGAKTVIVYDYSVLL